MAHDTGEAVRARVARFRAKQKLALLRVLNDPLVPYLRLGMSEDDAIKAYQADAAKRHQAAVEAAELAMAWSESDSMYVRDSEGRIIGRLVRESSHPQNGKGSKREWNAFLEKCGFSVTAGTALADSRVTPLKLGGIKADSDLVLVDDAQQGQAATTGGGRKVAPTGAGPDDTDTND